MPNHTASHARKRELLIDAFLIDDNSDCYVIAEIGHNHQGDLEKAKELFRQAKECGANAVKLQKRDNRSLFTAAMYNKPYDHEHSFGKTYGEHREFLEFGMDEYLELKRYAAEIGITFFATAFDFVSANFLAELDMPAYKIASGDLKNIPLIKHVAQFQKPVIVSLGGGTIEDAQRVYDAVMPINPRLAFLHCTATYPTVAEEINLRVITTLRERFPEIVIGLSDHYNGIAMAVGAYVLGSRIIEKHFTLNHTWKGTDHALSLEPIGMRRMVRDLRRIRLALGDGVKRVYPSEESAMFKMGKSLVAARDLPRGHRLTWQDIAIKSPAQGLPPFEIDRIIGKTLRHALAADEPILFEDIGEVSE
ncbi:N-acetylneuraminate synthase family protein [Kallotenue papyrolyticum]|uniref:N-acetylneuraminate synthase family protein n=1 Tax=Kallotenue papyrolyticum TaxID=1325125 RepID=UPI000492B861|nr:N-acetylneuraminate synthase family protein [Kallotenue papyrolyticum]